MPRRRTPENFSEHSPLPIHIIVDDDFVIVYAKDSTAIKVTIDNRNTNEVYTTNALDLPVFDHIKERAKQRAKTMAKRKKQ